MRKLITFVIILISVLLVTAFFVQLERGKANMPVKQKDQKKSNRLAKETSPYLLQHADNPVDWYPWGPEAFQRAKAEGKPIFLSIGYSTCHWCHVMEHESFEDDRIARILNENFISIKVDREQRPDIDQIYMNAVQAMTGQGGWPLSVFLTPQSKPFYGGTYFPPRDMYGRPGFDRVLLAIAFAHFVQGFLNHFQRHILPSGIVETKQHRKACGLRELRRNRKPAVAGVKGITEILEPFFEHFD